MKRIVVFSAVIMGVVISSSVFAVNNVKVIIGNDSTSVVYVRIDIKGGVDNGFTLQGKTHQNRSPRDFKVFDKIKMQRIGFSFTDKRCVKSFRYCGKTYRITKNKDYSIWVRQRGIIEGI